MIDLVKRLRDWTKDPRPKDAFVDAPKALLIEAADRIEALEAALREIIVKGGVYTRGIASAALAPEQDK